MLFEYDEKRYRNPEIFDIIRAYLFVKTGTPLTPKFISDDLNKLLNDSNFKTNDVTVKKYLDAMRERELVAIKRVYLKPSYFKTKYQKDKELEYGEIFYFKYSRQDLEKIYKSNICIKLRKALSGWGISLSGIQHKTYVALNLYDKYDDSLKSGVLVYQYYGDDGKEIKLTITVDFIVEENKQKTLFIFGNKSNVFNVQKMKRDINPHDICEALKSVNISKINIIKFWKDGTETEKFGNIAKELPGNCEFVDWDKVTKM